MHKSHKLEKKEYKNKFHSHLPLGEMADEELKEIFGGVEDEDVWHRQNEAPKPELQSEGHWRWHWSEHYRKN